MTAPTKASNKLVLCLWPHFWVSEVVGYVTLLAVWRLADSSEKVNGWRLPA